MARTHHVPFSNFWLFAVITSLVNVFLLLVIIIIIIIHFFTQVFSESEAILSGTSVIRELWSGVLEFALISEYSIKYFWIVDNKKSEKQTIE